jgi:hypothetical protein
VMVAEKAADLVLGQPPLAPAALPAGEAKKFEFDVVRSP